MTPPPVSVAQIHEQFDAVPFARLAAAEGRYQTTLLTSVTCEGTGLHSGADVKINMRPAPANTGIIFVRTDIENPEATAAILAEENTQARYAMRHLVW